MILLASCTYSNNDADIKPKLRRPIEYMPILIMLERAEYLQY